MSTETTLWNDYATYYDMLNVLTPYQEMYHTIVSLLKKHQLHTILDAGCGTGNLLHYCAQSEFVTPHFTCVDFSEEMLVHTRTKAQRLHIDATVQQINLNDTLPYADNTFAAIVHTNVLYALENPRKTIQELLRVLQPGGLLICTTPHNNTRPELILKAHAHDKRSDDFWCQTRTLEEISTIISEIITNPHEAHVLCRIAQINANIHTRNHYHFFAPDDLMRLITENNVRDTHYSLTYAQQNVCVTTYKEESR